MGRRHGQLLAQTGVPWDLREKYRTIGHFQATGVRRRELARQLHELHPSSTGAGATERAPDRKPRKGRNDERSLTSKTPGRSLAGNGQQLFDRTDAAQAVG